MTTAKASEIDLVLGGGGVKGIALAGAVLELNRSGYTFPRVAGTSAGAIAAALIAAYQCNGAPLSRLEEDLRELRYGEFIREGLLRRLSGRVGDVLAVLFAGAEHSGKYFEQWLGPKLRDAGVVTFGDLAPDVDWTDARSRATCPLVVTTTDLTRRALVRLPWDYDRYGLDPAKQRVVDAVHASMAIPFFFRQVRVRTDTGKVTWVDGGVTGSFAITLFDGSSASLGRPVWGVRLSGDPPTKPDRPIRGAVGMAERIARTVTTDWNRYEWADEGVGGRTIFVDTAGVSSTNFHLDDLTRQTLFDAGTAATRRFLGVPP
jgi:NTE family protein